MKVEVRRYVTESGIDVFGTWLHDLVDRRARAKIATRVLRLAAGNFGDCKSLREGVWELRVHCGPGIPGVLCQGAQHGRPIAVRWRQAQAGGRRQASDSLLAGLQEEDAEPVKGRASISHDKAIVRELRDDPRFAAEYLRAAIEQSDEPQVLLLALRQIAEARGGLARVAQVAGIKRESLYRSLSPKGNPRLSTLLAVTRAMGLQLTVEATS